MSAPAAHVIANSVCTSTPCRARRTVGGQCWRAICAECGGYLVVHASSAEVAEASYRLGSHACSPFGAPELLGPRW